MSYNSRILGRLRYSDGVTDKYCTKLKDKYTTLSDAGVFVPGGWDSYCGMSQSYDLEDEVRELTAELWTYQIMVEGVISIYGDDHTDIWRLVVDNYGRVIKDRASLTWSNGSKVDSRY